MLTKQEFLKKIKEIVPDAEFELVFLTNKVVIYTNLKEEILGEADDADTYLVSTKL